MVAVFALSVASHAALAGDSTETADGTLVIGLRRDGAPAVGRREWFRAGLKDAAYQDEAAAAAARLGNDKLGADEKAALSDAIRADGERAGRAFGACLDWHRYDATTRLGALRGIGVANPAAQTTGKALAGAALSEPVPQVRKAAVALIRERKDVAVTAEVVRYWRAAYDDDLGFDDAKRVAAVTAMRDIGDRRTYEALLYYATVEIYAGAASSATMSEVDIKGNGINLPIQLPGIDVKGFHGTIVVPALASLKGATGQDFGHNLAKWREWIGQQPEYSR